MITIRPSTARGHANHGWLDTRHTFSFSDYYDPKHMGFRTLRVINEDRVAPGQGFPTHPHQNMEIISYVVEGALEHRDSMGNGSVIRPGEVQRMSAGTGVTHSENNASSTAPVHFLQIWIVPERKGIEPSYEQRFFGDERRGRLRLVASRDGRDGSVRVHQDISMYAALLPQGETLSYSLSPQRYAWVQVVYGSLKVNEQVLQAGDGAAIEQLDSLSIQSQQDSEFLVFDLS